MEELAVEPFFEDVLDIFDEKEYFPACGRGGRGEALCLKDWRALRNCKYLRVTERNLRSLKEEMLRSLND